MSPKEIVRAFIEAFNRADAEALAALYAANAINHQVAERPIEGRAAIKEMFKAEFARAQTICIPDNLFETGAQRCFAERSIVYSLNRARFTKPSKIHVSDGSNASIRNDLARAILEWSDPLGLRGCGFFHIVDEKIAFQRGYWDKLSFLRLHGLPLPTS